MTERLAERHKARVQEGARRYLEAKRSLRDFIGPGGIKLTRVEQLQLYRDALNDPDTMMAILQNRQLEAKLQPNQIPRSFTEWLQAMQTMETAESPEEE